MPRKLSAALAIVALAVPAGAVAYSTQSDLASSGGRTVTYYNTAPEHRWAVKQAVRAWNQSGARVEFVSAPRGEAELVIEATAQGLNGHATTTYRGEGEARPTGRDGARGGIPTVLAITGDDALMTILGHRDGTQGPR